jgi:hypothetical protein
MPSEQARTDGDAAARTAGFFALNYGYQTPVSVVIAHLVYGIILEVLLCSSGLMT